MKSTALFLVLACLTVPSNAQDEVRFPQDIQPVLARKCYACHGPDAETREADLRLDSREAAVEAGVLDPDDLANSELLARILSDDPRIRMPPADSRGTLTEDEKDRLERWIRSGAKYEQHWAFIAPKRPPIPTTFRDEPNPIDAFVLDRLDREQLRPAKPAGRYTLVRRVYLDLIGLPPTPEEAEVFVNDASPDAYERLVDRLLASPEYGERWARAWLDLARYADTNGYEKDRERSIWPYRDWVIKALNADMPFDQFSIEQLAGDMLPNATQAQRVATGFHRNTMLNEEGGIDPLEYRFYSMVDRVATTGTVWMGLTTGCAQCHTHKYDPILHTDFYRLMALMDNADEPDLILPDRQRQTGLQQRIAQLETTLPDHFPPDNGSGTELERRRRHFQTSMDRWVDTERPRAIDWKTLRPSRLQTNLPKLRVLDDDSILSTGDITKRDVFQITLPLDGTSGPVTALRLEVLPDDRLPARGPGRTFYEGRKGDFFLSELSASHSGQPAEFASGSHSYNKLSVGSGKFDATAVFDGKGSTGWSTAGQQGKANELVLKFARPIPAEGELKIELLFERHFAASLGRFRFSVTSMTHDMRATAIPNDVRSILLRSDEEPGDRKALERYYATTATELANARRPIDALRNQLAQVRTTMVLLERQPDNPRPTFRHHRGEYLSPRERVRPGLPEVLGVSRQPRNRLEMAKWLVSKENPLAARVAVNRAWRAFFGTGLVKTSGDFGTQSEPPSHPKLLDWLAVEFIKRGWSKKKLHRLIVTSKTYRRDSRSTPELLAADPGNRLLARGPRFRVDAEMVRDIMLRGSGLLSSKMFGPSVYPPQPAAVTALAYGGAQWPTSKGQDRYRRSLYTFTKRTAPFAAFAVFDASSGENCLARRNRSNTPLQALTLLNDAMFLEMAHTSASRVLERAGSDADRLDWLFRSFLTRPPTADERVQLLRFYSHHLARAQAGEINLTGLGRKAASPEAIAWTLVARVIMNLDEVISRN